MIPDKILVQIKEKEIRMKKERIRKEKSLRLIEKEKRSEREKRNSSTHISRREFVNTHKYELGKTNDNINRAYNRTTKTTINKTL